MQDIRDLVNSGMTVLSAPIMYYLVHEEIAKPSRLSAQKILLFVLVEAIKIFFVHCTCFMYYRSMKGSKNRGRMQQDLSFSITDSEFCQYTYNKKWKISAVPGWCMSYLSAVIVCHLMLILFGAPVFEKWDLTLGFSCALVGWLFFPLTFSMKSSSMLKELFFLSSVDNKNYQRTRAKWSVLITIFGAWMGAVFIPLDWDRPWQQWPIPCMVTSFVAYIVIHLFYCTQSGLTYYWK